MNEEEVNIINDITGSLESLDSHVINIDEKLDEIIVIQSPGEEEKKDEQKEEKITEEKTTKSGQQTEQITEEITISDLYDEVHQVNQNLTLTNQILSGNILFLGVIVGVILFKGLFDRFKK